MVSPTHYRGVLYKRCSQTCAGRRHTSDVAHSSENDLWTMLTSIVHAYWSSTLTKFRFKVGYSTINLRRLRDPTRQSCHPRNEFTCQNVSLCNRMKWTLLGYGWEGSVCLLSFPRGFSLGPFSKVLAVNKNPVRWSLVWGLMPLVLVLWRQTQVEGSLVNTVNSGQSE